jgi:hypothetical protein
MGNSAETISGVIDNLRRDIKAINKYSKSSEKNGADRTSTMGNQAGRRQCAYKGIRPGAPDVPAPGNGCGDIGSSRIKRIDTTNEVNGRQESG